MTVVPGRPAPSADRIERGQNALAQFGIVRDFEHRREAHAGRGEILPSDLQAGHLLQRVPAVFASETDARVSLRWFTAALGPIGVCPLSQTKPGCADIPCCTEPELAPSI